MSKRKYLVMELGLVSVKIEINNCFCGVTLNNLNLPKKCFLLGLVRNNQVILATSEPTICCGDDVLAVALSSALIPALKFTISQTHPIYYSSNECLLNNSRNVPFLAESVSFD